MGCNKVGSGVYAGNSSCDPCGQKALAAKIQDQGGQVDYQGGIPYATTKINVENSMPLPIFGALGTLAGGLRQSKIDSAYQGQEYTAPKTVFGKIIGGVSGRTEAAKITEQMKQAESSAPLDAATQKNLARQGFPVGGAIQFGSGTNQTALPFNVLALIAATFVAIFYFFSKQKKGGRRRR